MPRRPRVFVEGGIYHIYNRLARGAEIFRKGDEGDRFVELLRKARDRDGLTVFAWVVMSNHYHLAVRVGPVPLWRTLGYVQARFGQQYNRRNRSTGPLWQSRYKARLVENESYLMQLIAYIHLNPVTAGVVDDPSGYPLSGHRELLGKQGWGLIDVDSVLATFGSTLGSARRRYVRSLEGAREAEWRTELPGRLPWWQREPDRPLQPESPKTWIDEQGRSTGLERARVDARTYLEAACSVVGVSPTELAGRGSNRWMTRRRCLVVALGVERWRQSSKDLADHLGRRADVVTRWVRWGIDRCRAEELFQQDYDALDRALSESLNEASGE